MLRAGLLRAASALGLALVALAPAACEERAEDPCTVAPPSTVLDFAGGGQPISVDVVEEADRTLLVTWLRVDPRPSADAGAGAGVTKLARAERARLTREGAVLSRSSLPIPPRLAARQGSTDQVSAVWTDGGVFFRWVESTTATLPNGQVTRSLLAVTSFVPEGGGPVVETTPTELACSSCAITLASASTGPEVTVLASLAYTTGTTGALVFRFDARGKPTGVSPAPPFAQPLAGVPTPIGSLVDPPGGAPQLGEERGDLFLFSPRGTYVLGPALEVRAGPLPLAGPGAFVRFDPPNEVVVAAPAAGTSTGEPFVTAALYDARGRLLRASRPVTRATAVGGVAPIAGGTLFVTRGEGGVALSRVDASGAKRGYDVSIATSASSLTLVDAPPLGARLFEVVGSRLDAREVTCAP